MYVIYIIPFFVLYDGPWPNSQCLAGFRRDESHTHAPVHSRSVCLRRVHSGGTWWTKKKLMSPPCFELKHAVEAKCFPAWRFSTQYWCIESFACHFGTEGRGGGVRNEPRNSVILLCTCFVVPSLPRNATWVRCVSCPNLPRLCFPVSPAAGLVNFKFVVPLSFFTYLIKVMHTFLRM